MINAYASIWRCLMHDIIIKIREKACVHVHDLEISTQEETFVSHYTVNIWKVKMGSGGASPPEANRMKRSQIKWKHLLFHESDFLFLLRPVYFLFSFNRAMFILSQNQETCIFL